MIDDIIVIDDFLSDNDANLLEELATSHEGRWVFHRSSVDNYPSTFSCKIKESDLIFKDHEQFVMPLVWQGEIHELHASFLAPVYKIKELIGYNIEVQRLKLNFITCAPDLEKTFNAPHVDKFSNVPFLTLIYYINSSDGGTILFNERSGWDFKDQKHIDFVPKEYTIKDIVQPVKNRAVLFSGDRFHCNQPPIKSSKRIVINYNFVLTK